MGVMNKIFGGKKGYQCARDPNTGNMVCDVFEVSSDTKVSTGTHIELSVDPNSCTVVAGGQTTVVEGDENEIAQIKKSIESGCRKGIA